MSRRREQKQQEKEDFLEQNPELITYETRFEVVPVEKEEETSKKGGGEKPTRYEVEITQDGEELEYDVGRIKGDRDLTQVRYVESEAGDLSPGYQFGPEDGPPQKISDVLTLSEYGFGISQASGKGGPDGAKKGEGDDREPPSTQDFALDGDEVLVFQAPRSIVTDLQDSREAERDLGNIEFGIDYTVLGGRGTVEIILVDYDGEETVEGASGFLRAGQDGSLDVEMPEGTYEEARISVTGNLEIAIVGIDVTSNTDGGGMAGI